MDGGEFRQLHASYITSQLHGNKVKSVNVHLMNQCGYSYIYMVPHEYLYMFLMICMDKFRSIIGKTFHSQLYSLQILTKSDQLRCLILCSYVATFVHGHIILNEQLANQLAACSYSYIAIAIPKTQYSISSYIGGISYYFREK